MREKISVVTPSFNQGRFIRQTIESVLSQDYDNYEYIVVDGGSTDETVDIIKEYEGRLTWISEKDGGQSDAINKGFRLATGEILGWLNSDDTYEPGALTAVADAFAGMPQASLIYGEGYIMDEAGDRLHRFAATTRFDLWKLIHVWDYILQPAAFFRKKTWIEAGCLDERLHWTMDWDLWLRIALRSEVAYLPYYLANSREYGETKTSTGNWERLLEIRETMSRYSRRFFTEGFWLYYYDTLSKGTEQATRDILMSPSVQFLSALPVPDENGFCRGEARICFRPGEEAALTLTNKGEESVRVSIWHNGHKLAAKELQPQEIMALTIDTDAALFYRLAYEVVILTEPDNDGVYLKKERDHQ
jgi:GT2 family glycosyltransferase